MDPSTYFGYKIIAGTNATVSGISFAHFSNAQTAQVGAEIGQLLGMSILLLTIILFSQFRTGRDTALVLHLQFWVFWGHMELVVF